MSNEAGTLELVARELGRAFGTLTDQLSAAHLPGLFARMGVNLPPSVASDAGFANAVSSLTTHLTAIGALNVSLTAAIDSDNGIAITGSGTALLTQLGQVFNALTAVGSALDGASVSAPGLSVDQRAELHALALELPRRLLDLAVIDYLRGMGRAVVPTLLVSGLVDDPDLPADPGSPTMRVPRPAVHIDRLTDLFVKPGAFLSERFGWGTPSFDGLELFARLRGFLLSAGLPASIITAPGLPAILEAFVFRLSVDPSVVPPALTGRFRMSAIEDVEERHPLNDRWSFVQEAQARFDSGLDATIRLPFDVAVRPPAGTANVRYRVGFAAGKPGVVFSLLGATAGTRLEAEQLSFMLGFDAAWDAAAGVARGGPLASFSIDKGKAVIDTSKGDSFLSFLTGSVKGEANFSLSATWTATAGLKFSGSSGLEIAIPTHAGIGPATLTMFYLRAGVDGDGSIPVELSAAVTATLGPLDVSVDGIGLIVRLRFPKSGGNLGPLNVGFEFKAPTGVGLSLDGGGFKGGGFLRLDFPKGQYAGALELEFAGIVSVKAIGILDTKLPGGGFSLLIIITAEFIPIQLGFGFTLVGVGGLLGLNRTVQYEPLRAGVHDGSLNSILFPTDIVANAPRIINDLGRIFPPMQDRFLIGPMAKFGWGTPTILSLELGLILEIPRPAFAILGVLRASLPAEDAPLLKLQVNFLGIVDFGSGQLSFDASLVDSRLLAFALSGDMAVRLYWGDNANFLLTVGGFHPAYTPPPMGLGPLQRLSIEMFGGMPRIRAEAYFAVTSNTVQFGAKLELYAGADIFNVYGFLALDVLFQFNPFHFIAEFSAMLAVRSGSSTLFGIRIEGLLEGPTPLHARGTGSFEIGFIITVTISVHFDVTFGDNKTTTLPPVDVLPLLAEALGKKGNWRAIVPEGSNTSVTLRELPAAETALILHPFGTLEISQKLVPLNLPITRFGSQKPAGGTRFAISQVSVGGTVVATEATKEQFAPAQFLDMTDADKLSRRSFDRYDAGVRVGGGDRPNADYVSALDVAYEVIYLPERRKGLLFRLSKLFFDGLIKGSAAAQSSVSFERRSPSALGTPRVEVQQEKFAVATSKDLTLHGDDLVFASEGEAHAAMHEAVRRSPDLAQQLQVVPLYQVNQP